MTILAESTHPDGVTKLVVDADAKACYAYIRQHAGTCGDVWLYNTSRASDVPEWRLPNARSLMPFSNPPAFGNQTVITIQKPEDVRVEWARGPNDQPLARVFVREQLWAELGVGDKPGRCVHAIADGPLARRLMHVESGAHS